MRVLRNPDVCALTLTTAAVGIAASGICFYFNPKAGLIAAAAFVIVISAQLVNAAHVPELHPIRLLRIIAG